MRYITKWNVLALAVSLSLVLSGIPLGINSGIAQEIGGVDKEEADEGGAKGRIRIGDEVTECAAKCSSQTGNETCCCPEKCVSNLFSCKCESA